MRRRQLSLVVLLAGALIYTTGCAGYNTQLGAATGAGAGALVGYGIGHDTTSALLGAALGGTAGAVIGHGIDTYNSRYYYGRPSGYYYGPPSGYYYNSYPGTTRGNYWKPAPGPRR